MKLTLAYLAGLVDGEGYIGIKKSPAYACQGRKTPGYHARIQVRMVDERAIRLLAETLGGWYYREREAHDNRRALFCYQASDKLAADVLRKLLPFLRIKSDNAKAVLALRDLQAEGSKHRTKITGTRNFPNAHGTSRTVNNLSFSDAFVAQCEALYEECKRLNHAH